MRDLQFELSSKRVKPVFSIKTKDDKKIQCLFDTGATMPVWCQSEEVFKDIFPNAVRQKQQAILSGFGKIATKVDVYKIPEFHLSDGNSEIVFKNLLVVASFDRDFGCDLILSYTMFTKTDYSILNFNRKIPLLQIKSDRDEFYATPVMSKYLANIIDRASVFASDEETAVTDDMDIFK